MLEEDAVFGSLRNVENVNSILTKGGPLSCRCSLRFYIPITDLSSSGEALNIFAHKANIPGWVLCVVKTYLSGDLEVMFAAASRG